MYKLPKSFEGLETSYEEAYEHVRLLEERSKAKIFDTDSTDQENGEDVFTYRHNDELATVRRIGEDIVLEGGEEAKTALSYLEPSEGR